MRKPAEMNLVAMMPVRNEDWILGFSARVALRWCDQLIIGLHACADRSGDIATELESHMSGRVHVHQLAGEAWDEMRHRQELLEQARKRGATHCAIVDADEVLTANLIPEVPAMLSGASTDRIILQLPGYNLRNGIDQYHGNGVWSDRWFSTVFQEAPYLQWSGDRFHQREPQGGRLWPWRPILHGCGGVMHFWGASERRLRAKHALYKLTERIRWPRKPVAEIDRQYSLAVYGRAGTELTRYQWTFKGVPASWMDGYGNFGRYLDVDREPWQEAEVRRLVKEMPETARGLDLFGIADITR